MQIERFVPFLTTEAVPCRSKKSVSKLPVLGFNIFNLIVSHSSLYPLYKHGHYDTLTNHQSWKPLKQRKIGLVSFSKQSDLLAPLCCTYVYLAQPGVDTSRFHLFDGWVGPIRIGWSRILEGKLRIHPSGTCTEACCRLIYLSVHPPIHPSGLVCPKIYPRN